MIDIRHTALSIVIVATVITPGSAARAASGLSEETTRQLAGRCMVLGSDASFGPQLSAICDATSPPVSGDIGGGVSATGSASTSPGRRLLDDVLSFRPRYDAAEDDEARTGSQHSTMAHRAFSDALDASWFIRGVAGDFERDTTDLESGYDATLYSLFTGLRFDVGESAILGFGLEYARINADDFNIGGFDSVVYGPTLFAAFRPGDHLYVASAFSYRRIDEDRVRFLSLSELFSGQREISGLALSESEADKINVSFELGYTNDFGALSVTPRVGLDYGTTRTGSYSETGQSFEDETDAELEAIDLNGPTGLELFYLADKRSSLKATAGIEASAALSVGNFIVTPRLSFDAHHEFLNDPHVSEARFAQDFRNDPTIVRYAVTGFDANYVTLGASVDIRFRNDTSAYVGMETILGHAYIRGTIFQVGYRAILF